ncbi:MAG: hypothetical protein NWF07_02810 [Candidatus Bathyarchaeota archaeon]|nr:hypothetical protein [Candidatus Bathyarchaeota archaeon]
MYSDDQYEPPIAEKPKNNNRLVTFFLIINILLGTGLGLLYRQNVTLHQELEEYAESISTLSEAMVTYEQQLNMTEIQLEYYRELANQLSCSTSINGGSESILGSATVPLVAVKTVLVGFSTSYEGEVMLAEIELVQGEGRVLVDTEVINGADIQTSLRTAAGLVTELTGVSFSGTDIILTIESDSNVEMVDGPSAGAVITIALYAAVTGQTPVEGVYMTGTINSEGTVGSIGGVQYKGVAVAEDGGTVFLVPMGQSTLTTYQAVTKSIGRRSFTYYEAINVDLEEYLSEHGYTLDVIEVGTIEEAISYFFNA